MSAFLKSLSPEERDELLTRIPFVDKPKSVCVYGENAPIEGAFIVNYSQLFALLTPETKEKFPFPAPADLRTGDMIVLGGYRGVGSYYAMWLAKDLVTHSEEFVREYEEMIKDFSPATKEDNEPEKTFNLADYPLTEKQWKALGRLFSKEEWYENWESEFNKICDCPSLFEAINQDDTETLLKLIVETHGNKKRSRKRCSSAITLVKRESEGPHSNPAEYDVYLFLHPDEMGYAAPSAFSSASFDYFPREYFSVVLDPLLTHSQSYYGQLLREYKENEENEGEDEGDEDSADQLIDCDRFDDEDEEYDFSEAEFVSIDDGQQLIGSMHLPEVNYFVQTRELFANHFKFLQEKQ